MKRLALLLVLSMMFLWACNGDTSGKAWGPIGGDDNLKLVESDIDTVDPGNVLPVPSPSPKHSECMDGQCVLVAGLGENQCTVGNSSSCNTCYDSDGDDKYTKGHTYGWQNATNMSEYDFCISLIHGSEWKCFGDNIYEDVFHCDDNEYCEDGRCIVNETATYSACDFDDWGYGRCVEKNGTGSDECYYNTDCPNSVYSYCNQTTETCEEKIGFLNDECNITADCGFNETI